MNSKYNYADFTPQSYDFTNRIGLQVGETLPDIALKDISGKTVKLRKLLGQILVLETGSITCPLYVGKIKSMNTIAREHQDVNFVVIYIREAHPGNRINAHENASNKVHNAQVLKTKEPENRTILIDSLEGTLHERLGLLPNMAYVIDKSGTVLYRANWNIPDRIDEVLKAIKSGKPITQEPADFTPVAPGYSLRVLARAGGIKAVWDFAMHLPQLIKQHMAHRKTHKMKSNQE
ncbi:MAG: redoxin domain-containing protein [Robiginitomaculum sp.]|nr:redoxin domain-containing protein [Robiginitomaculum sp.]